MPQGFPITIVEKNGIPVIPVLRNAPLVTVAENGLGTPVVIVEKFGVPLIFDGVMPFPAPRGMRWVRVTHDGEPVTHNGEPVYKLEAS